ncbi:MAG: P1 family peptidase [Burkholderiales bacterium]|nr:P1 family peptidase [Burkholderiales bacterium]
MTSRRPLPRELDLPLEGEPGPTNSIADVGAVAVGYWQVDEAGAHGRPFRTGVTAILPFGAEQTLLSCPAAVHSQNGNGEMTGSHWIRDSGRMASPILITNTHGVGAAHEAAVRWMVETYPGLFDEDHAWALPVVAETYDGFTNDLLGFRLRPEHARLALDDALRTARAAAEAGAAAPIAQGNVGGGMGMQSFAFKGGSGSSSRRVRCGGVEGRVGVFVQSNFGNRDQFQFRGVPIGRLIDQPSPFAPGSGEAGSLITIVATDLPLDAGQLDLVARRVPMGVALLGGRAGNHSGEISLAFSVANARPARGLRPVADALIPALQLDHAALDPLYEATVQATEEAILNALFAARSMPTHKPPGTLHALDVEQMLELLRSFSWR